MSFERVSLDGFGETFAATTELSSVALGGEVKSVSDEFFADAFHLLLVEPAPSMKGQFGPNGALYNGWETRRHNPNHDWCILKLGTTGTIVGFDVDTANFNGNEAPQVSVDVLLASSSEGAPQVDDTRWSEILPKVDLGPNSRHLFQVPETSRVNYVRLNMYPDGGIARFRVYGHVSPVFPSNLLEPFDLAHVFAGGHVEYTSDQHFGIGANLIMPGRGKDMGDGWETKRSRQRGHKDWVIIQLGAPGILEHAEIDTAHFKGNFPESCELHGLFHDNGIDWQSYKDEDLDWTVILPRTKVGPHRQHYFQLDNVEGKTYTHVKVTIHPDGGLKRVRIIGRRADTGVSREDGEVVADSVFVATTMSAPGAVFLNQSSKAIPVLPLTPEAFAPFGQVIQAYGDHAAAPKGVKITPANGGTASKFHKLSLLASSYPPDAGATTGLSVYRCDPFEGVAEDGTFELKTLERHSFTNQAFVPMGRGTNEGLSNPGDRYLVVVAQNGPDDRPDLTTLRAFTASAAQGIMYRMGIWHQPMTVLDRAMDFTCVETQIGDGGKADCEILDLKESLVLKIS